MPPWQGVVRAARSWRKPGDDDEVAWFLLDVADAHQPAVAIEQMDGGIVFIAAESVGQGDHAEGVEQCADRRGVDHARDAPVRTVRTVRARIALQRCAIVPRIEAHRQQREVLAEALGRYVVADAPKRGAQAAADRLAARIDELHRDQPSAIILEAE